ncbi:hypothetical protein [Microbispora rosea]|uniref:hypothetical protein n=1 Tax=Microbispora rosea TaxID=58117 RepID=UPI000A441265|nr:hypothetical protein [Microbispora rosea]
MLRSDRGAFHHHSRADPILPETGLSDGSGLFDQPENAASSSGGCFEMISGDSGRAG